MTTQNLTTGIDNSGIDPISNHSANPSFQDIVETRMARRSFLKGSLAAAVSGILGVGLTGCNSSDTAEPTPPVSVAPAPTFLGFAALATNRADAVTVPAGYTAKPFLAWGTPITGTYPNFLEDATNTAQEQAMQMGMNHDGMHFFPIDVRNGGNNSAEGLLVMNHEYVEPNVLHPQGPVLPRPAEQAAKEIAAHGVSVVHIQKNAQNEWQVVANSPFNRRITAETPMAMSGPVRGHSKLVTKYSQDGTMTRGTINNCAHGYTPWGTYLTAEENWAGYFMNSDATQVREHSRYGVRSANGRYFWETATPSADRFSRFNASTLAASAAEDYRHEPNTFGWIVEIDPFNPDSVPQKRTALGRFAHEGIVFANVTEGEPIVAYSGDDARNEYIYKFVSKAPYFKNTAGGHLLNEGTLYVARFNADGSGDWLPLDITNPEFIAKAAVAGVVFSDQADVLLNTRLAADVVGATKMDRPEWGAVHPETSEVYFTLTNNTRRTEATVDAANPRANNTTGHIIRWKERSNIAAVQFDWDIFLLAGDVGTATPGSDLVLTADNHLASPDGIWFDDNGLLWIQTDMSGSQQSSGPYGNNQMLIADPQSRQIKRFLVGPVECEVTGVIMTPDHRTMFVNIQHPGDRSTATNFTSNWPAGGTNRPRSATVIITKDDGGIIGS